MVRVEQHHGPRAVASKSTFKFLPRHIGWQDADWGWLRKQLPPEALRIVVHVWPRRDNPIDPGLTQHFAADSLNGAKAFAKEMIRTDQAVLISIRGEAYLSHSGWVYAYDFGYYQPARGLGGSARVKVKNSADLGVQR